MCRSPVVYHLFWWLLSIFTYIFEVLYKLFHSVIDQIISHQITAHYTSPCYFPTFSYFFTFVTEKAITMLKKLFQPKE